MKKFIFTSVLILTTLASAMTTFAWGGNRGLDQGGYGQNNRQDANVSKKVTFYVQTNGVQMDKYGSISSQDKKFFTGILAETTISKNLSSDYKIALGNGVTEKDITDNLTEVPNQSDVLKKIVDCYESQDAYIRSSNGSIIPWTKMNSDNYRVEWYALKYENSDGWHVDGCIIDLETDKEISIVVPSESAKKASCVEYDVASGKFTPGVMQVKGNRPHSYWNGDNENLVIDGFDNVWYTVLDEDTFTENDYVIPAKLISAASAVETLANARLSGLTPELQKEYGRIDSQAYKQEYINRTGAGRTLYVTPFITNMLAEKYGVSSDEYIWLAMGDSCGNVKKVYVMDRDMAAIDNLFDNE